MPQGLSGVAKFEKKRLEIFKKHLHIPDCPRPMKLDSFRGTGSPMTWLGVFCFCFKCLKFLKNKNFYLFQLCCAACGILLPQPGFEPVPLQWKCVCYLLSCVQLFVTLWTVVHQAPLSTGFSRQEYWSGLPFPPPEALPDPGIKTGPPVLAGRFFTA